MTGNEGLYYKALEYIKLIAEAHKTDGSITEFHTIENLEALQDEIEVLVDNLDNEIEIANRK